MMVTPEKLLTQQHFVCKGFALGGSEECGEYHVGNCPYDIHPPVSQE